MILKKKKKNPNPLTIPKVPSHNEPKQNKPRSAVNGDIDRAWDGGKSWTDSERLGSWPKVRLRVSERVRL